MKNDGSSAFPAHGTMGESNYQYGMSLRDYFAAKALIQLIPGYADHDTKHAQVTAMAAYAFADAMLKEREK